MRRDSTVTAAPIHEPSDSSLLWDAVRMMVRLLRDAEAQAGRAGLAWRDHRRAAKQRARDLQFTRGRPRRLQLYRELIRATGDPGLPAAAIDGVVALQHRQQARAVGRIVVPLITPILPDYLERLDGFEEWRRRLRAALPADVALRDYSAAITDVASFRDDLHLNRRGVRQLMSRLRRDRVPGVLSPSKGE